MKKKTRKFVIITSIIGIAHFAISLLLWGMGFIVAYKSSKEYPQEWWGFVYAIPAVILFLLFIMTFVFAYRKSKYSVFILLLSILLAMGSFAYDASNRNYQMHAENFTKDTQGGTFHYFTWWWYNHY